MKERPILFSGAMVRAILDGRKTQTRRVVKPVPDIVHGDIVARHTPKDMALGRLGEIIPCPYGAPGDRLWVRETFRFTSDFDGDSPARVGERCIDAGYTKPWAPIHYEADGERRDWMWVGTPPARDVSPGKTRVSIHMPRWASRITLEITSVLVERLNDCSEEDALAEGVFKPGPSGNLPIGPCVERVSDGNEIVYCQRGMATAEYRELWDQINGAGAWAANPWVWVVEFRRAA
ncbi:hypothetical protein [Cupriavidus pauculus]|uniref:Morphogenetic protein n=1 Tax=Cupriavidus pauculus TaxID=82633 RepID=A0A3G8H3B1_9BURK|nr:hypothetical protein [Cupriavidus pauculus]AZG14967.1 hypothetical protein EHF44_16930 [Cupriavidus pauculus]